MYLNLIHKIPPGTAAREAVEFQLAEARRLGLRATLFAEFASLYDPEAVALMRRWQAETGGELGIHFHPLGGKEFEQRFHSRERAIYLHPRGRKAAIIKCFIGRFRELFGCVPRAIGSYILDAWTLRHIKAAYPEVKVAITNCFEEGVKMFHGNNHNWTLFSDGGPWGPFYPSKDNALCPARDEAEWAGIVALPHLNRDMIMALTSRDDLFSSHPGNLFRARINESGGRCPYLFRFIDEWMEQARWNGWSYYNVFVSVPWVMPGHWAADDHREVRALYTASLEYLAAARDEGRVRDVTMEEYADAFRRTVPVGEGQACLWRDVLTQGRREMFWFANPEYRVAVDLNIGGTVCDLRPYSARLNRDMGPDTPALWNGNHPYLISAELRGGAANTHLSCQVCIGNDSAWITDGRTSASVERSGDTWVLQTEPIQLQVGPHRVTLVTRMYFDGSGVIRNEREITACEPPPAGNIILRESFRGTWGTLDYHENMQGIVLALTMETGEVRGLPFAYDSVPVEADRVAQVSARIPQLGIVVSLRNVESEPGEVHGFVSDGTLFHPYFTLALQRPVAVGGLLRTAFTLEQQEQS